MRHPVAGCLAVLVFTSAAPAADPPNFLAEVSRVVVNALVGDTRDRPEVVNDEFNGTRVVGGGQSHAEIAVEFVPSDARATLDLVLTGTAKTRTIGHAGAIKVTTNGLTQFAGRKRVTADAERLTCGLACVRVRQDTELEGVGTEFSGPIDRLLQTVAARTYYKEQEATNHDAARSTERSISAEFDRDAGRQIADANGAFADQRRELRRRGLWPQDLRLSTTLDELRLRARFSGVSAADLPPPPVVGRPDVAVRVHGSLFNNFAAKQLGGRTVTGDELDREFTSVLGPKGPSGGRLDADEKDQFTVTFAAAPLTAEFAGGQVRAVVHTCGFTAGDRQVTDPFDIRIAYDLTRTPTGLVVTRRELEVLPAAVAQGKRRMSLREGSIAKLLCKAFAKLLPEREQLVLADLPGPLKKLGRLLPTQAEAANGWLAVAWRRQ